MFMAFQVFTDTSSGMSKELRQKYSIDYFPMGIIINDKEYPGDLDYKAYTREQLYDWVKDPNVKIRTSLIPATIIMEKCEKYLSQGIDVLYVACSSGLSGSRGNFELVKEELLEKYPGRKMISVDSLRAEMALGLIAVEVAKMRDKGVSIEEAAKWVEDNRQYYHEVGSIDTLKYLRAFGRVSGAAAFFADTFNIKPVIAFDIEGTNNSFKKVRGEKKAMEECFQYIKQHMVEGQTDVIYVGETMPNPAKDYLKKRIIEELHLPVEEYIIGPIVGVCCGPGMYGCWFRGDLVTLSHSKK